MNDRALCSNNIDKYYNCNRILIIVARCIDKDIFLR